MQVFSGNINTVGGCATFFRRDRFAHVKKYEVWKHNAFLRRDLVTICAAIFCNKNLHMHLLQVEFNKAAQSLIEAVVPSAQKKTALNRMLKVSCRLCQVFPCWVMKYFIQDWAYISLVCAWQDNIALIVVLEAKFNNQGFDNPGKRQLVCVVRNLVLLFFLFRVNFCVLFCTSME